MTNSELDGIVRSVSEPGRVPQFVEYRVWPENVVCRSQQSGEDWFVYSFDHRPTGKILTIGTFGPDEYNAAEWAALNAAEAVYRARVPAEKLVAEQPDFGSEI